MGFAKGSHTKIVNKDGSVVNFMVLDGFALSDADESSPAYYGYVDVDGNWYIMKATVVGTVTSYTYASGTSGYATARTNRASQTYKTFNAEF